MSFRTFSGGLPRRFRVVQQSFLHRDDLAFAEVLSEQDIQVAFDAEGVRFAQEEGDVYTPSVTLWAFLSQAVFKAEHRSCVAAVARVAVLMAALNRHVSHDTGAYCCDAPSYRRSYWSVWPCSWQTGLKKPCPPDWLWHGGTCIWWMGRHSVRRFTGQPSRLAPTHQPRGRPGLSVDPHGGVDVIGHGHDDRHALGPCCA